MRRFTLSFLAVVSLVACDKSLSTGPTTPTNNDPAPVAAAPAPTPAATPKVTAPSGPDHDVNIYNGGTFTVTNNSSIPAKYVWYKTSFDDQKTPIWGPKEQTIGSGGTLNENFGNPICEQGDIAVGDYHNVPIGAAFFDINGKKFNPSSSPEKVTECRNRCVVEWHRIEDVRVITDWTDFVPEGPSAATVTQKCYKWQHRLIIHREQNSCDKSIRDVGEAYWETRQVEIPCPCVPTWTVDKHYTRIEGEWSTCVLGVQTKIDLKVWYKTNSCTQERVVDHQEQDIKTRDCQTPGGCFYTISSAPQGADRQALCQQAGGINYIQWNEAEKHCVIHTPGVYQDVLDGMNFNLVPGKSDDSCRKGKTPKEH